MRDLSRQPCAGLRVYYIGLPALYPSENIAQLKSSAGAKVARYHSVKARLYEEAAKEMEFEAYKLRGKARDEEAIYHWRKRHQNEAAAVKFFLEILPGHYDHMVAISQAAREFGIEPWHLEVLIKDNKRALPHLKRWIRNRNIMIDARRMTNGELAKKYNLSPGRICQIIGQGKDRKLIKAFEAVDYST